MKLNKEEKEILATDKEEYYYANPTGKENNIRNSEKI